MEYASKDILFKISAELHFIDLFYFCLTNKRIRNKIYLNDYFWKYKAFNNLGYNHETLPTNITKWKEWYLSQTSIVYVLGEYNEKKYDKLTRLYNGVVHINCGHILHACIDKDDNLIMFGNIIMTSVDQFVLDMFNILILKKGELYIKKPYDDIYKIDCKYSIQFVSEPSGCDYIFLIIDGHIYKIYNSTHDMEKMDINVINVNYVKPYGVNCIFTTNTNELYFLRDTKPIFIAKDVAYVTHYINKIYYIDLKNNLYRITLNSNYHIKNTSKLKENIIKVCCNEKSLLLLTKDRNLYKYNTNDLRSYIHLSGNVKDMTCNEKYYLILTFD